MKQIIVATMGENCLLPLKESYPKCTKKEADSKVSKANKSRKMKVTYCSYKDNKVIFKPYKFIDFLENKGFGKLEDSDQFIRQAGPIVQRVTTNRIKDFILDHLKDHLVYKSFMINSTRYFESKYLSSLKSIRVETIRDIKGASFHFYKNGWVIVTTDKIKGPISYEKLDGLIWEDQIIDRDFINLPKNTGSVFNDFIYKLSNNDTSRIARMQSLLGYMMHGYRTNSNTKAIIINDEEISDNPEGGSGKGLMVIAVSKVIKTRTLDGKKFNVHDKFVWENIDETTRLVHLDDIKRGFNFEDLFPVITAGFTNINRKHKPEISLPIDKSPLIVISTNNLICGAGGSNIRRQYNVDVYQYFSSKYTPIDEYGHEFFNDWDYHEWNKFDMYMMSCIQKYLKNGIPKTTVSNRDRKECIKETCQDFVDFMDDKFGDYKEPEYGLSEFVVHFKRYADYKKQLSERKASDWIKTYCEHFNLSFKKYRILGRRLFSIS